MTNDEKLIRERALNSETSIKEELPEETKKEVAPTKNGKPIVKKGHRSELKVEFSRNYELEDGNITDIIILKTPLVEDIFNAEEEMKLDNEDSTKKRKNISATDMNVEDLMMAQINHKKKMIIYVASIASGYAPKFFKELYQDDFDLIQNALSPFLGGL